MEFVDGWNRVSLAATSVTPYGRNSNRCVRHGVVGRGTTLAGSRFPGIPVPVACQ